MHKPIGQQRDVVGVLPQGRHMNFDYGNSMVEIFAEIPFGNLLPKVFVRGGHHPYIHRNVLIATLPGRSYAPEGRITP